MRRNEAKSDEGRTPKKKIKLASNAVCLINIQYIPYLTVLCLIFIRKKVWSFSAEKGKY